MERCIIAVIVILHNINRYLICLWIPNASVNSNTVCTTNWTVYPWLKVWRRPMGSISLFFFFWQTCRYCIGQHYIADIVGKHYIVKWLLGQCESTFFGCELLDLKLQWNLFLCLLLTEIRSWLSYHAILILIYLLFLPATASTGNEKPSEETPSKATESTDSSS